MHEPGLAAPVPGPQRFDGVGGHDADPVLGRSLHQGGYRDAEGVGQPDQGRQVRVALGFLQCHQSPLADLGAAAELVQRQTRADAG